MRLKYEPGINGEIVIRVKEEPAVYYDECAVDKLENFVQRIQAYYSEKGELVEIRMYTGDLEEKYVKEDKKVFREEARRIFKEREEEIIVPEIMPQRRYIYKYGEDEEPLGCVDHYTEIYDQFMDMRILTMWRLDGREMNKSEIAELRRDFLDDAKDSFGYGGPMFIESVYRDKKLYFWEEEHCDPHDILNCVHEIFEEFDYEIKEIRERDFGADVIVDGSEAEELFSISTTSNEAIPDYMQTWALVCIFGDKEPMEKEELIEICKNTNEYKNRMLITGIVDIMFSEEAVEYAKSQNIWIQEIDELLRKRNSEKAWLNDSNPELFEYLYFIDIL